MAKPDGYYHEIQRFQNATKGALDDIGSREIPAHTVVGQTAKAHNKLMLLERMDKALDRLAEEFETDPTGDLFSEGDQE